MPYFSIPVLDPEFDDFECGCEQCDEPEQLEDLNYELAYMQDRLYA